VSSKLYLKYSIILAACAALTATTYSDRMLARVASFASIYSFCFLLLLFVAILPTRLFILGLPFTLVALKGLSRVNEFKISAVGLPVTAFDARVVLRDPSIVVNALGAWHSVYKYGVVAVLSVIVACGFYFKKRRSRFEPFE
jgi:hypothetical protein